VQAAELLGVDPEELSLVLRERLIKTGSKAEAMSVPNNVQQCQQVRDALAKALYARQFDWIVKRVNSAIAIEEETAYSIGVLDIYGFEVFQSNGFEQFCINFVNEKLQQIFVSWEEGKGAIRPTARTDSVCCSLICPVFRFCCF
jgi:myosin-1